jgi:hypothetical protein
LAVGPSRSNLAVSDAYSAGGIASCPPGAGGEDGSDAALRIGAFEHGFGQFLDK